MQLQTTSPENKFPNECSDIIFIQIDQHLKKLLQKYKGVPILWNTVYIAICSPSSAFQWSQNAWPWMTLNGYFALNSVFSQVWLVRTVRLLKNNCVKTNEDTRILSAAQIFGRVSSFWQCKVCAGVRSGSVEKRHQTTVGSRVMRMHVLWSLGEIYSLCA